MRRGSRSSDAGCNPYTRSKGTQRCTYHTGCTRAAAHRQESGRSRQRNWDQPAARAEPVATPSTNRPYATDACSTLDSNLATSTRLSIKSQLPSSGIPPKTHAEKNAPRIRDSWQYVRFPTSPRARLDTGRSSGRPGLSPFLTWLPPDRRHVARRSRDKHAVETRPSRFADG